MNQLLPDVIAKGDVDNGQSKFRQLCASCHHLHGEGGNLGPDLTGANRLDLYYLLENIIDPAATLPADYQLTVVTKNDGGVVSGNIKSENEYTITIKNPGGEEVITLEDIKSRETLNQSLMPEGLLQSLTAEDVRDLIAYLQK